MNKIKNIGVKFIRLSYLPNSDLILSDILNDLKDKDLALESLDNLLTSSLSEHENVVKKDFEYKYGLTIGDAVFTLGLTLTLVSLLFLSRILPPAFSGVLCRGLGQDFPISQHPLAIGTEQAALNCSALPQDKNLFLLTIFILSLISFFIPKVIRVIKYNYSWSIFTDIHNWKDGVLLASIMALGAAFIS